MSYFKKTLDPETMERRKVLVNCLSGALAGSIAAAATNALEAITVAK